MSVANIFCGLRSGLPMMASTWTHTRPLAKPIRARLWFPLASTAAAVVLILVFYWLLSGTRSQTPPKKANACTTLACREYAERLHASVNRSVNPCKSFTRFVCSGWQRNNLMSVWEEYIGQVFQRLNRRLRQVEWPSQGQNEEQRVAAVFQSCDDVLQGKSDQLTAVKIALADAGIVWPQHSQSADVLYTLLHCSFKLRWDALLEFRVKHSADEAPVLTVSAAKFFLTLLTLHNKPRTQSTKKAYFQFLRKAFLNGDSTTYADSVTYQETSKYDGRAMTTLRNVLYESPVYRSVADIENVPHINFTKPRWVETLRKLNVSVAPDAPYPVTTQLAYVQAVLRIWEEFGEDSFHLFVSWCTVQIAALYANRDLILNFYNQLRDSVDVYHTVFCVSRAAYFSPHAAFSRYNHDILKGGAKDVAQELVLSVRSALFHRLASWNPVFEDIPDITLIANWSSLSTVFRSFDYTNGVETVDFGPIPDMTHSFVDNWKHSVLVQNTEEAEVFSNAVENLQTQFYVDSDRDIQLMPYALYYPFFDLDWPAAVNYGGLGAEVGLGLVSLHLSSGIFTDAVHITSFMECISQQLLIDVSNAAEYVAVPMMFASVVDAYKLKSYGRDVPLPGFEEYNGLQTLFISQCYSICKGNNEGDEEYGCDLVLPFVPEFAVAFNCSRGDPMYPAQQCRLL